jgi:type VI secretion system secreted protein VgrG
MSVRPANFARFEFTIDGVESLDATRIDGMEGISRAYTFTVESAGPPGLKGLFRRGARLRLLGGDLGEVRVVHGIVHGFGVVRRSESRWLYRFEVGPRHALLRHRQDCRIFQERTTAQIIREVMEKAGVGADELRFVLFQEHPPRPYCVQYHESDWNFVQRLLEEDGCFYFFEHEERSHTLIIGDEPYVHPPLPGGGELVLSDETGMLATAEHVLDFSHTEEVGPGKYAARDYNFLIPFDTLDADAVGGFRELEVFEYPGAYDAADGGRQIAQTRLQALQARLWRGTGRSGSTRPIPGSTFHMRGKATWGAAELEQEFLIIEVRHRGDQPQGLGAEGAGRPSSYSNWFECTPASRPFRPARATAKPRIVGPQTAVVTGPAAEEVHTDEHGRVKVKFHWDRASSFDDSSSCWVRVAQAWAGSGWGSLWIPRVGHEVVVAFLDGDPDRPIITGSVYHGVHAPPYPLPAAKTCSTIKSDSSPGGGGSNEILFEDRKGAEEVVLHAQRDLTIGVENDTAQSIGRDEAREVGRDCSIRIGRDQRDEIGVDLTARVGRDRHEDIGRDLSQRIGGSASVRIGICKDETVTIASSESVGATKLVNVGAAYQLSVGAAMSESVGLSRAVSVGQSSVENTGKDWRVHAGAEVEVVAAKDLSLQTAADMELVARENLALRGGKKGGIEVADELVIRVGQATVTVKKSGAVYIGGTKLTVKTSGEVIVKGAKVKIN